jgi:transcriptional regulator with XRE-family HTH domain
MDESETFVGNVLRTMVEKGLTAAELSRRAGLNARAVKDLEERRVQSPKLSTAFALAKALGMDPGELMGLGPRAQLQAELVAFLQQYSEEDQARLLTALQALPPPRT